MVERDRATGRADQASRCNGVAGKLSEADSLPRGIVVFEGTGATSRMRDLEHMVRTVASRVTDEHPEARILEWRWATNEYLVVTTSTELLAYEIAESVQEAQGGRFFRIVSGSRRSITLVLRLDR